jgi:hypothetical protein
MSDVDSNGVDWLDRFHAYSERFKQSSVAGEVYLDTLEHIKLVRKERDEARRLYCNTMSNVTATYVAHMRKTPEQIANEMGWDCFKENIND